jgi:hypothetical protein
MSSRQKRKQARLNGAKAAGTKSPAGIERSSMNAIKHGLNSKMVVLTNESKDGFDKMHESYIQTFQPANTVEMDLIDQMAAAQWRLRRIWFMQTAALDLKMDQQEEEIKRKFQQIDQPTRLTHAFTSMANEEKSLDLFLRYETAYTRMYQRALGTLLRLRRENEIEETPVERTTSQELRNDAPSPVKADPKSVEIAEIQQETTPQSPLRRIEQLKPTLVPQDPEGTDLI